MNMKKFVLRYGVFAVLAIMLTGIAWMAESYTIRVKQSVTLFVTGACCKAYVSGTDGFTCHPGDTFTIHQTPFGDLAFIIDSVCQEPSSAVFSLHPQDSIRFSQAMNGNSYASGFIFTGREKMGELILNKLKAN